MELELMIKVFGAAFALILAFFIANLLFRVMFSWTDINCFLIVFLIPQMFQDTNFFFIMIFVIVFMNIYFMIREDREKIIDSKRKIGRTFYL